MNLTIIVNTHNRERLFSQLNSDILKWSKGFNINLLVFFDGCDPYPLRGSDNVKTHAFNLYTNHGKDLYYKLIQYNFEQAAKFNADYVFKIDDDMGLIPQFFDRSIAAWESIKDEPITLNLLRDEREKMWGSIKPEKYNNFVRYSDWVDLNFMCKPELCDVITSGFLRPRPPHIQSSGVGRQITRHIRGKRFDISGIQMSAVEPLGRMYQVNQSYLIHNGHESVMNPERKETINSKL